MLLLQELGKKYIRLGKLIRNKHGRTTLRELADAAFDCGLVVSFKLEPNKPEMPIDGPFAHEVDDEEDLHG